MLQDDHGSSLEGVCLLDKCMSQAQGWELLSWEPKQPIEQHCREHLELHFVGEFDCRCLHAQLGGPQRSQLNCDIQVRCRGCCVEGHPTNSEGSTGTPCHGDGGLDGLKGQHSTSSQCGEDQMIKLTPQGISWG